MASQGVIYDQFRQRLRDERERRGWSQQKVADLLAAHGVYVHPTAVTKVEAGSRGIRLDMLWAFADIYGVSVDALLGRSGRSGDLAWAVSKLASNAQKAATEVDMVAHRLRTEYDEVRAMCRNDELPLLEVGGSALMQLSLASSALSHLADQFPLPTAG
jgi:transcriptional regulator with XRE-family HTH domain